MKRVMRPFAGVVLVLWCGTKFSWSATFTPLAWQQEVMTPGPLMGLRKNTTWVRDQNRDFVDDEITGRFHIGNRVDIIVDLNKATTAEAIKVLLGPFGGRITHTGRLVSVVLMRDVLFERIRDIAELPRVAMVEWMAPLKVQSDVAARFVQARKSVTYMDQSAEDLTCSGIPCDGSGVTIAFLDTGIDDDRRPPFCPPSKNPSMPCVSKFVAGFDATKFEDTNGNGIDDSCEPFPLGDGSCSDPTTDEPGNGTTNPPDGDGHGSRVGSIALGSPDINGKDCRQPTDGSPRDCSGIAPGARFVDIRVPLDPAHIDEGLISAIEWLAVHAQQHGVRVANISIAQCGDDDGSGAWAQNVDALVAAGVFTAVAHGNASNCGFPAGKQITLPPGSSSMAMTVSAVDDHGTISRSSATLYNNGLAGPRTDYGTLHDPAALKPDMAAPGVAITGVDSSVLVNTYDTDSGTSYAAPAVAGAAAIVLQAHPSMNPGSLKDLLKKSADPWKNVPAYPSPPSPSPPSPDPVWDKSLGDGMLNVYAALSMAATTDVGFPSCAGPPLAPGLPCTLTAPAQPWENTNDLHADSAPQANVPNTVHVTIHNSGSQDAKGVLVSVQVSRSMGDPHPMHLGTSSTAVTHGNDAIVDFSWTPSDPSLRYLEATIAFGQDTNFDNNVTQTYVEDVTSSPQGNILVQNPMPVPAHIEVHAQPGPGGWACSVTGGVFDLEPFLEPPRPIGIRFAPPPEVREGDSASCRLTVSARPVTENGSLKIYGGLTLKALIAPPCRIHGTVMDEDGRPVPAAAVSLVRMDGGPVGRRSSGGSGGTGGHLPVRSASAVTDEHGSFSLQATPLLRYSLAVESQGSRRRGVVVTPVCGEELRVSMGLKAVSVSPFADSIRGEREKP